MVAMTMQQQHHHNHNQNQGSTIRSPNHHNHTQSWPSPITTGIDAPCRIRLSDISSYDGAPIATYNRAVESLSNSLTRHNAAVIELGPDDAALLRCALDSARLYFRTRKGGRGVYHYRAGRPLEDVDSSPPCMADIFRCMGRAARATLCAVARHLRLRNDLTTRKSVVVGGKLTSGSEVEKGLLMLVSSDAPGLQVRDQNGCWYQADSILAPGELLLLTGKALSHATAGLRPASSYRCSPDNLLINTSNGRTSLAFRLMPQGNAILDCSPLSAAGHVIPQSYVPISVSQFMDDLSADEDVLCNHTENAYVPVENLHREPSLRSVLSDPLSGAFLEDAMLVSCGHSFGGLMLRKVIETSRCTLCDTEIGVSSLVPNHALRAAAMAVKLEDDRRLFHSAALRKRRKEGSEHKENGDVTPENGSQRGVQYPFSVNEKVVIKGNRRTPDKFVGKEAVITSQCLNGWYLLRIIESGENIRLQYRSLRKNGTSDDAEDRCISQPVQDSS